ncbi:MAG TPA: PH domain-containing protein [Polyangiaceae bacterium]
MQRAPGDPSAALIEPGEEVLFEGTRALVPSFGLLLLAIFTLGIWLLPLWWQSIGKRYRITSRRIVIQSGLLSQRLEQVDLYRISDYTAERSLGQRLMGTGSLVLQTYDKTTPVVRIEGIKADVVTLYERLRAATEAEKTRRNVRVVDYE